MSKRDEFRHRLIVRGLLSEWYDGQRAKVETIAYSSPAVNMAEQVDKLLDKVASPEVIDGIKLRESWPEIAGKQIAAISEPINLRDGIAEIGVFHNAWLRELKGPIKNRLLQNINRIFGDERCREIRFVPGARPKDQ